MFCGGNMLTCVTAIKNKKQQYLGMYADPETAKRVSTFIEDFAGKNWKVKEVVEFKQIGDYNARSRQK